MEAAEFSGETLFSSDASGESSVFKPPNSCQFFFSLRDVFLQSVMLKIVVGTSASMAHES